MSNAIHHGLCGAFFSARFCLGTGAFFRPQQRQNWWTRSCKPTAAVTSVHSSSLIESCMARFGGVLQIGLYAAVFAAIFAHVLLGDVADLPRINDSRALTDAMTPLQDVCVERFFDKWGHMVCFGRSVLLVQYDSATKIPAIRRRYQYERSISHPDYGVYLDVDSIVDSGEEEECPARRRAEVHIECCRPSEASAASHTSRIIRLPRSEETVLSSSMLGIRKTIEKNPCSMEIHVCSSLVCANQTTQPVHGDEPHEQQKSRSPAYISEIEQSELRIRVQDMFVHAYDSYIAHAFPHGELHPIECSGGPFEPIKLPAVTLIDTLDTLVIMNNYTEFRHAVSMVLRTFPNFDIDENVSVFETTIRLLGGLLSAHMFSVDPDLPIFADGEYENQLLILAKDLGDRLMPAFGTKTGIPYGTVNLRKGVPKGETKIASTAGAGSLLLEFQALSLLTGDPKYGQAAFRALEGIYARRSNLNLVGKHIHIDSGQWQETSSGVGSNSDSFYEYLLKAITLEYWDESESTHRDQLWNMFLHTYSGIKSHILHADRWFSDVDMFSGNLQRRRMEALDAFWPGVEASIGMLASASKQLNAFFVIAKELNFVPEELDWGAYAEAKSDRDIGANLAYPLRPEVAESTYFHYRSTRDRSWLLAGKHLMDSLENLTRTGCGYASVANLRSLELNDNMPSYFLAETLKYLYLLFAEDHYMHDGAYVYTTEAHPLDLTRLHKSAASFRRESLDSRDGPAMESNHQRSRSRSANNDNASIPLMQSMQICSRNHPFALQEPYTFMHPQPYSAYSTATSNTPDGSVGTVVMGRLFQEDSSKSSRAARHRSQLVRIQSWIKSHPTLRIQLAASLKVEKCSPSDRTAAVDDKKPNSKSQNIVGMRSQGGSPGVGVTGPLKRVDVNMGALGDFQVSVFADGFSIESKGERKTVLDVFNSDKHAVLVREADDTGARLAMGRAMVGSTVCEVAVVTINSSLTHWRRACSIGTFGPQLPVSVRAPLATAVHGQGTLCTSPPVAPMTPSPSPVPAKQRSAVDPWWWSGASRLETILQRINARAFNKPAVASSAVSSVDLAGRIVVARRGECLFEDKAQIAEQLGAAALIVRNSENALFVMAGKREVEQAASGSPLPVIDDAVPMSLPVVMLTQSDAISLEATAQTLPNTEVMVSISMTHDVLQTADLMGNRHYPKVFASRKIIYVLTSSTWGAYFKSQQGDDWQMYLMSKRDITTHRLLPVTTVLSPEGRRMTTSAHLLLPPQRIYMQMLQRKCPRAIRVVDGGKTVHLLDSRRSALFGR